MSRWWRRRAPVGVPDIELVVPVDGLLLRTRVLGAGRPIVLVHGLGTSARSWRRNIEALSRCGRLYVVDLPGFGESDTPPDVLAPRHLAGVLARWCLAVDVQHATFIGHSLGGEVCMWFAATYPTMVDGLVLAASTGVRNPHPLPLRFLHLLADGLREPPTFLPTLLKAYWKAGPVRMLGTIRSSDPDALLPELGKIVAPTLVVWGQRDPVIGLEEARTLTCQIPQGRLAVIEDGAHGIIFDAPERFNQLVCAFLDDLDPAFPARHPSSLATGPGPSSMV